jgi:hypothetical protein
MRLLGLFFISLPIFIYVTTVFENTAGSMYQFISGYNDSTEGME